MPLKRPLDRLHRRRAGSATLDRPAGVAPLGAGAAEIPASRLEELRVALHGRDPQVYAKLTVPAGAVPVLSVGPRGTRVVVGRDRTVFQWGRWGGVIGPVSSPDRAAAAILADLAQRGGA
ncbi:hypothetical protein [Thermomonospora umbrina]|nr:hypothetical protein [Thermomonospora umbrina]